MNCDIPNIPSISTNEWEESTELLNRMIQKKKSTMFRILQIHEKVASINKMLESYSSIWDTMYEKFNLLCTFQQNATLQLSLLSPPTFPPYTDNIQITSHSSEVILRNSMITTIRSPITYPHITDISSQCNSIIDDNYLTLWNFFRPLREIIQHTQKEKKLLEKELEEHYAEMEKYKAYFVELIPRSSNQLSCGICQEVDKKYTVFIPCGHLSCMDCGVQLRSCHICRKKITTRQPLYN